MKSVLIKRVFWMLLLLPALLQAKEYKEGVEYIKLVTPLPTQNADKIEVQEFFWYGCSHCFDFEPRLAAWASDATPSGRFRLSWR